jgi:WXG100 family type VII secretion target
MAVIRIDTAEVQSTGGNFKTKSGELEGLVQQARSLMDSLRGQFMGQRATSIFSEWDGMQQSLTSAVQTLDHAGTLLTKASSEFSAVDSTK